MEKKNANNDKLVKEYEYYSMIFKKQKEDIIQEYNNKFKLYKETKMRNDNYSQKIISLHHLYEHEIKINKFYYDFVNASSKNVDSIGVNKNNEINFWDKNVNQLTKEQKLRIQINKNAAVIKRLEKQLDILNSKVDEYKKNLITKYTNHLLSKKK